MLSYNYFFHASGYQYHEIYGDKHLPPTREMKYVDMQLNCLDILLIHGNMTHTHTLTQTIMLTCKIVITGYEIIVKHANYV